MIYETEALRAAVLNARSATLFAEVCGMVAENEMRRRQNNAVAYAEDAFQQAIIRNALGENGIIQVAIHGELK